MNYVFSNSLVQLIMCDQWLDQSCDELSTSFRESEVVSMHGAASHQLCVRAFTCLCQDPLRIAILELVKAQSDLLQQHILPIKLLTTCGCVASDQHRSEWSDLWKP